MKKVLVTDHSFADLALEEAILSPLGCALDPRQCRTPDQLVPAARDADFVLTQFAPVNRQVIAALDRAKLIVRYGVGVDNVDLDAARERGIAVCNVPDYCVDEVADQTLAFILAATRQVVPNCLGLRGGRWGLAVTVPEMKTLRELTVGVIGLGRIGREVLRRLVPFGCRILVFDPGVAPAQIVALGAQAAPSVEQLLPESDVLTLHCPSTPRTRRMIGRREFGSLKPGAILVNVSRGDIVDTAALVEALKSGRLGAAALDVCDPEPIPADHPLLKMPNVTLAPHIASVSPAAQRKLREGAANAIARAVRGEALQNVVNGVERPR
ncbi:MAG TPA: C-terminal binding protein [Planctomycetota bacterium]|nr:C-terminal binding protein [Planctomycetota bacterium]